jgi:hypothetical protein
MYLARRKKVSWLSDSFSLAVHLGYVGMGEG